MTEQELARSANRRLAIIHHAQKVSGSVAVTCRYYGITRQTYYHWLRRYVQLGKSGLRDLSRRAHHCPHATSEEVVGKIVHLRQNYHFGRRRLGCISSVTTRSRSAPQGSGESSGISI